jgi:excinuclease ABC subunit C
LVDGGKGQLGVCSKVLADVGLDIPHIGLAKRLEEVYFPGQPDPLMIPRASEGLFVLQHIRDEAHRFAITYHRQKRAKRRWSRRSTTIPGVGPARKKAVLKRFGSLARLRTPRRTRSRPRRGSDRSWRGHLRPLHDVAGTSDRVSA